MTGMSARRKKQRMAAISYGPTEPPVNIELPEITGMFGVGQTVTCTPGVWEGADTIAYQWLADGVEIPGETGSTLDLTVDYVGQQIDCRVTATNALGSTAVVAVGEEVWAVTPARLFADGQDGVWLDPSDHSTLWIDEERTQNATQPGDVVWWIDDKSGNENHFSVDASANRSRLVRWPASAVKEGGPRNMFLATSMVGASVPNTLPTGWSILEISAGLAYEVAGMGVEDGFDYIDVRFHGTPGGTGRTTIQHMPGDTSISAGDITYTTRARLVGGTGEGVTIFRGRFILANGANRNSGDFDISTGGTLAAREYSTTFSDPSVTAIRGGFSFSSVSGQPVDFTVRLGGMQLEQGDAPTPYQRVGAGHWDVTEEGQPDCWGILGNGVNTRYISERGIPEYVDGKVRLLVGQTKIRPDSIENGCVLTNSTGGVNTTGSYVILAHLTNARSYYFRYTPVEGNVTVATGMLPSSAILDSNIDSSKSEVGARVNSLGKQVASGSPGPLSAGRIGLLSFPSGATYYEGIIWSTILTAYDPDETLWNRVARDWLNNTNMLGVLDDD